MPRKRKKCWTADALRHLDSSLTPQHDSEQDLGSPEALISRDEESSEEDKPFLPRFLLQEFYLRAQVEQRVQSQQARLAAESSVQIRLASPTRNLGDGALDPTDSRARCYLSVQYVRTVQPVGGSASPRLSRAAGSSVLVRKFWQGRQPMLWAHRQYLRLGARPLEV